MENEKYMHEGLDIKRLFLCFADKLWRIPAAVILGALIGAGICLIAHLIFKYGMEYQSVSKAYISFNC